MTDKPKKKEMNISDNGYINANKHGYNQACDDWEKWLDQYCCKAKGCSCPKCTIPVALKGDNNG